MHTTSKGLLFCIICCTLASTINDNIISFTEVLYDSYTRVLNTYIQYITSSIHTTS